MFNDIYCIRTIWKHTGDLSGLLGLGGQSLLRGVSLVTALFLKWWELPSLQACSFDHVWVWCLLSSIPNNSGKEDSLFLWFTESFCFPSSHRRPSYVPPLPTGMSHPHSLCAACCSDQLSPSACHNQWRMAQLPPSLHDSGRRNLSLPYLIEIS